MLRTTPERTLAAELRRGFLTAAVIVAGVAGTPRRAIAQPSIRDDSTGAVFVSRRELRVAFPAESKATWEWPPNPVGEDAPTFFWYASFHGIEGRVTITLQDSALIARLFALRPDSVPIVSHLPRYLGDTRRSIARVHYGEQEREVLVTAPIGRLSISPRPTTMDAGDTTRFAVDVVDRKGRKVQGAPVDLSWGVTGSHYVSSATKPVGVSFDRPGHYEVVAVLGKFADTVNVEVRPRPRAP